MNYFWKKTGWLSLTILGLLASLFLQIVLGAAGAVISAVVAALQAGLQGMDQEALMELIQDSAMDGAVWGVLGYHVVSLPVFGLWYYFGCGRKKMVNPLRVIRAKRFLVIFLVSLGLCLFANGMVLVEEFLMPSFYETYVDLVNQVGFGVNPITIIASVLLAPIGEELLCRGIIFYYAGKFSEGMWNRKAAFWIANVLQALLFGIMHGNVIQGSYAFALGLGLGYLRFRYDSLYASILAHFLINFLSTFVLGFLLASVPETMLSTLLLLAAGVVIVGAALFIDRDASAEV